MKKLLVSLLLKFWGVHSVLSEVAQQVTRKNPGNVAELWTARPVNPEPELGKLNPEKFRRGDTTISLLVDLRDGEMPGSTRSKRKSPFRSFFPGG